MKKITISLFSFLLATLIIAGCGQGSIQSESPQEEPALRTQSSTQTVSQDFCNLLSAEQAAQITGTPITRASAESGGCFYYTNITSGFLQGEQIAAILSAGPTDVEAAKQAALSAQQSFQQTIGSDFGGVQDVSGVGDGAFFQAFTRQLVWVKGGKGYNFLLGVGFQQENQAVVRTILINLANAVNANL